MNPSYTHLPREETSQGQVTYVGGNRGQNDGAAIDWQIQCIHTHAVKYQLAGGDPKRGTEIAALQREIRQKNNRLTERAPEKTAKQ